MPTISPVRPSAAPTGRPIYLPAPVRCVLCSADVAPSAALYDAEDGRAACAPCADAAFRAYLTGGVTPDVQSA